MVQDLLRRSGVWLGLEEDSSPSHTPPDTLLGFAYERSPAMIPPNVLWQRALLLLAVLVPSPLPAKPPFYSDKNNLLVYLDAEGKAVVVKSSTDWQRRREHVLAGMQLVMGQLPPAARKVALEMKVE